MKQRSRDDKMCVSKTEYRSEYGPEHILRIAHLPQLRHALVNRSRWQEQELAHILHLMGMKNINLHTKHAHDR